MTSTSKRFRAGVSRTRHQPSTGRYSQSFGARVGYWPCLGGPFITIYVGSRMLDVWYGRPSYLNRQRRSRS